MCAVRGRFELVMPHGIFSPVCGIERARQVRNPCTDPARRHSETKGFARRWSGWPWGGGFCTGLEGLRSKIPPRGSRVGVHVAKSSGFASNSPYHKPNTCWL